MWNSTTEMIATIAGGIVMVAILAVLVSKKAQTPQVIQAAASGFSNALATAIAPVTGATANPVLAYPAQSSGVGALGYNGV